MRYLFPAALLAASILAAQAPPSFEAASVKKHVDANTRGAAFQIPPTGRVHIVNVPLYIIIALAYDLPFQSQTERLTGGPDWLRSEPYDIEATAGALPPAMTAEERIRKVKAMLRALLADRFHLELRQSARELPIYTITVAKSGPKLKPAAVSETECMAATIDPPCHEVNGGVGRGLHGKAISVSDLAHYAESWSDRPLVDRSGLTALYEVDTEGWVPPQVRPPSPDGAPPSAEALAMSDPGRPTLFVIMDRLGLALSPSKGPVAVYHIERVERPAGN